MENQILPPIVDQIVNDLLNTLYGNSDTIELRIQEEKNLIRVLREQLETYTISELKSILKNVGLPLSNLDKKSDYVNRFIEYLGTLAPPNSDPRQVNLLLPLIGYPDYSL